MMAGAVVRSVGMARQLNYAASLRLSAFGLCKAKLEQIRAEDYSSVESSNFPKEPGLSLSHLSGKSQNRIFCDRSTSVQDFVSPDRKVVGVTVSWQFRGRPLQEQISGVLYE